MAAINIVFARSIIACVALALIIRMSGKAFASFTLKDYGVAITLGLMMSIHWVTYFAAMQYSTVAIGMIALFTFPIITVMLEPLFEDFKLVWQMWRAVPLCLLA